MLENPLKKLELRSLETLTPDTAKILSKCILDTRLKNLICFPPSLKY